MVTEHMRKICGVLFLKDEGNKPRNWWEDNITMSNLETGRNFLITEQILVLKKESAALD